MAYAEGLVKIKLPAGVFMNPPQTCQSKISIFTRRLWGKPPLMLNQLFRRLSCRLPIPSAYLRGCLSLALRHRYAKVIRPPIAYITANDISPPAVELTRENFADNQVTNCTIENKDAVELQWPARRLGCSGY